MSTELIIGIVIIILVINGIASNEVAEIANKKEIGYNKAFLMSFCFTPIFGVLLTIASPIKEEKK